MSSSHPTVSPARPAPSVYFGLFVLTLATLVLELGLTRIFSVIIYYHMAFFAVSVTLFGLAFGAVIVHFLPRVFTAAAAPRWMARSSLAFAITVVGALWVMLAINFQLTNNRVLMIQLLAVSLALAVPFTCSGVAVALALTRYPAYTNRLYGYDLAGAALGCLLYGPLIALLGGPGLVLGVSALAMAAGWVFAMGTQGRALKAVASALLLVSIVLAARGPELSAFQIRYLHGVDAHSERLLWQAWNAISRITVYPIQGDPPGMSPLQYGRHEDESNLILIDSVAGSPIPKFDGEDFAGQRFAFHDISYIVHAIRNPGSVFVIGVGGGRDMLAARAWGQPEVVGAEINSRIIEAYTEHFADYAGNPDQWEGVTIIQDEARSYLARSERRFDVIQASLIDTFAATSAGAFVLTENSLYTIDGWTMFFDHLTEEGIITMTRWWTPGWPVESVRLIALARASLEAIGVENPRDHILMARVPDRDEPGFMPPATILVKKTPFTPDEITAFREYVQSNGFIELAAPDRAPIEDLAGVLTAQNLGDYVEGYHFDISPPTDNRPFFFDVLHWGDIFKPEFRSGNNYVFDLNLKPLIMLGTLLATVVVLSLLLIVVPLALEGRVRGHGLRHLSLGRRLAMLLYFIMLGLGYILIELALIQRFTIFLGHPGYSLTVCLFTMLLASGAGSMVAPRLFGAADWRLAVRKLSLVAGLVVVLQVLTMVAALWVMENLVAAQTPVRVTLAALTIAPVGFLMGMPFPLAIQVAARRKDATLAWFWGMNGAFSVCASVLVVVIGHNLGLLGSYSVGMLCYGVAALAALSFGPLPGEVEEPTTSGAA